MALSQWDRLGHTAVWEPANVLLFTTDPSPAGLWGSIIGACVSLFSMDLLSCPWREWVKTLCDIPLLHCSHIGAMCNYIVSGMPHICPRISNMIICLWNTISLELLLGLHPINLFLILLLLADHENQKLAFTSQDLHTVSFYLEPRSLLVFAKEAYTTYLHGIDEVLCWFICVGNHVVWLNVISTVRFYSCDPIMHLHHRL